MLLLQVAAAAAVAAPTQMVTYHVLDPKYTGVRNKNTGDIQGDLDYILEKFTEPCKAGTGRGINCTVMEKVLVEVTNGFGKYQPCNPHGHSAQPCDDDTFSCDKGIPPCVDCPPGKQSMGDGAWYMWPKQSEGKRWRQIGVQRRVKTSCVAEQWRKAAGGCPKCGEAIQSTCVLTCIKGLGNKKLGQVWEDVMGQDNKVCPEEPMPCKETPPPPPTPPPTPMYFCTNHVCTQDPSGVATLDTCKKVCK